MKYYMGEPLTIKKDNNLAPAEDYNFLRKEGIRLIEKLSGKVWTDYNTQDPGITLLEALCYTLTDLGYRTSFEIKDLLATQKGIPDTWDKIFFTARQILPCNPVTLNDYRKLIIDTNGVRNAWIEVSDDYEVPMYIQIEKNEPGADPACHLTYDQAKGDEVLHLRGLYKVFVEYENHILASNKEEEVASKIREKLNFHRNICEDFISVTSIEYEYFKIEAALQVSEGTDIERINASIYKVIADFLSPPVTFYTLEQMVEKGYTSEEIFEGPVLRYGFIDTREMESSERYKDIYLSDIIRLILEIEGVIAIKKLALPLESQSPLYDFTQWVNDTKEKQKAPRLDIENSIVTFVRSGDRHREGSQGEKSPDKERVKAIYSFLQSGDFNARLKGSAEMDFNILPGEFMNTADYFPLQSTLPSTYGMAENYIDGKLDDISVRRAIDEVFEKEGGNAAGLSDFTERLQAFTLGTYNLSLTELNKEDVSNVLNDYKKSQIDRLDKRKKQTLQLQGFLMVFEQILSDYLSQLAHVRDLFSFDPSVQHTYFTRPLEGIRNLQAIFIDYNKYLLSLPGMIENEDNYIKRRNSILDHLLGRFAESMDKYPLFITSFMGKGAGTKLINDKLAFLSDYIEISNYRGKGFDYRNAEKTWDTPNVEGLKKRICRLLGLTDYNRKHIASDAIFIEKVFVDNSIERYVVILTDPANRHTVLLRSVEYEFEVEARNTLNYMLEHGTDLNLYESEGRRDKWSYQMKRPTQEGDTETIATGLTFRNREESDAAHEKTIKVLTAFSENENFHIIDHILLRPKVNPRERSTKRNALIDADTVSLLPAEDISDREAVLKKEKTEASYKFKITNKKGQNKKDNLLWKLSLLDKNNNEILLVEDDFLFYKHLTRRMELIRQFASDQSNYIPGRNADGYFTYEVRDGMRQLAAGKRRFRVQEEMDAEISGLISFFSFEGGKVTESTENFDNISYFADPYSLRISIFIPAWPKKFRNPSFRHMLEKTIYLETPAHIYPQVYWLDHRQMRELEEAYKLWLEEMANEDIPNTEVVNNLIAVLNESRNNH